MRHLRRVVALAAVAVLGGCGSSRAPSMPAQDGDERPYDAVDRSDDYVARRYVRGLEFPVDMAWVPGTSKVFVTERKTGSIRVVKDGFLLQKPCKTLEVGHNGLEGIAGIALHPNYAQNHYLYVMFTLNDGETHDNRVVRFKVRGNRCTSAKPIVTGIAPSRVHNGGQLEFMDGHLFIATGEANMPAEAQDPESLLGKILRVAPNGDIPDDNPIPGNPVWSLGHRNPFGLAHRPGTDQLFETENGPECDDELNLVRPGANYGWGPHFDCTAPEDERGVGDDPQLPLKAWTPIVVPTDLWWYEGTTRELSGALYMAEYPDGKIHRFDITKDGTEIVLDSIVWDFKDDRRVIDVAKGPRGFLYFLTDTAIFRLAPD